MGRSPGAGYIIEPMPWWFWIVLWSGLLLGSLSLLAWLLWRVLGKGLAVLDAAEEWERLISSQLGEASSSRPLAVQRPPAVFTPVSVAVRDFTQGKQQRTLDRAERRIKRRDQLGQPQLIGDLLSSSKKGDERAR